MRELTKDEMKQVVGGRVMYTCTCAGGTGQWFYTSGDRPADNVIASDVQSYCSSGQASCIYAVQEYSA
ncbi:MAG: bacteriocin [Bacteroidetes bacterium]|nr:bacteriocin [Bacteroidota bacterium]